MIAHLHCFMKQYCYCCVLCLLSLKVFMATQFVTRSVKEVFHSKICNDKMPAFHIQCKPVLMQRKKFKSVTSVPFQRANLESSRFGFFSGDQY